MSGIEIAMVVISGISAIAGLVAGKRLKTTLNKLKCELRITANKVNDFTKTNDQEMNNKEAQTTPASTDPYDDPQIVVPPRHTQAIQTLWVVCLVSKFRC